jgi:hypothetical protein
MRRLTWIGIAALVALLAAGIAVAAHKAKGTDPVAATFTAAQTKNETKTCTGPDGTYNITRASYEGTSTGDPRLTGKLSIRTHTVVNVTNGYGWTKGHVAIRNTAGKLLAKANIVAVNSERGVLNGFATGRTRGASEAAPAGALLANFSATVSAAGAVTGSLGGTSTGQNTAIVFSGACDKGRGRGRD